MMSATQTRCDVDRTTALTTLGGGLCLTILALVETDSHLTFKVAAISITIAGAVMSMATAPQRKAKRSSGLPPGSLISKVRGSHFLKNYALTKRQLQHQFMPAWHHIDNRR